MGDPRVKYTLHEAAAERSAKVGGRPPGGMRVSERRCSAERSSTTAGWIPSVRSSVSVRGDGGDGGPLVFEGFASVTGQGYEMWDWAGPYTEYVHVGAFAETLAQSDLDVPLVIDHVSSRRIARTGVAASPLMLSEVTSGDTTGLKVLAPALDATDPDTAYIVPKLRSGLIDEMSFRFMITSGRWSDDWMEYHIHAVDIHRGDVSIVGYGANPHTAGSGLREQAKTGVTSQARMLLELSRADDVRRSAAV